MLSPLHTEQQNFPYLLPGEKGLIFEIIVSLYGRFGRTKVDIRLNDPKLERFPLLRKSLGK